MNRLAFLLPLTLAACVTGAEDESDTDTQQVGGNVCSANNYSACEARMSLSNVSANCRHGISPLARDPNTGTLTVLFENTIDCTVTGKLRVKHLRIGKLAYQINAFAGAKATALTYTGVVNGKTIVSKTETARTNSSIYRRAMAAMPNDFCKNGDAWVELPFSFRTALQGAKLSDGAIVDSLDLSVESVSECP